MSISAASVLTLEALRSVPLFSSLDDKATADLRDLLSVREISANAPVFGIGDAGDSLYLVDRGRVRISVRDTEGKEVTLAELAGGDFFGEMALIDGRKRSADARVLEDVRLVILSETIFWLSSAAIRTYY